MVWQNQKLDKQTKMIQQAGSQFNEALMKSDEALMSSNETVELPQLKFLLGCSDIDEFVLNGVKVTYQENSIIVKDIIYEFSVVFINFLTNPNVTYGDIEGDENKIKRFLIDMRYNIGKGDKISSRYKTIKFILGDKEKIYGSGLTEDKLDNQGCNSIHSLIERLELLILETKAEHDELYDEIINISKQLLSMNNINQEQLNNFVFNYGK